MLLTAAFFALIAGAFLSLFLRLKPALAVSAVTVCAASALALPAAFRAVLTGGGDILTVRWGLPMAEMALSIDPLSAFFMLPVLIVSPLCAVYAFGYLPDGRNSRHFGFPAFFLNMLVLSMLLLFCVRNGLVFIIVWEIMTLSSYFLVVTDWEKKKTALAGWLYLVAAHIGAGFIFAVFALLGGGGSMGFDSFHIDAAASPALASMVFVFALIGFGVKAGLMPMHIWLPEAHPAAPSHVSALMSGVMIKTGVYGFLRCLTFFDSQPQWWGNLVLIAGALTACCGVAMALAQHDIKRLMAYSSVENIGIIFIGVGLGMTGVSLGLPSMAFLGFAGALFHIFNHSLFKSLLFLGAGAVIKHSGVHEMDLAGGLSKKMRLTSLCAFAGCAAICGLPPFNGFAGEFVIYWACGSALVSKGAVFGPAAAVCALALSGGLALAAFCKYFGAVFLGEPRSGGTASAKDPGFAMSAPMVILAALCLLAGLAAPAVLFVTGVVAAGLLPFEPGALNPGGFLILKSVICVSGVFLLMLCLAGAVFFFRKSLPRADVQAEGLTWDCGFARPTARMQYTGSSFAQPLTRFFRFLLRTKSRAPRLTGVLPGKGDFDSETPDICQEKLFSPMLLWIKRAFTGLNWLESNSLHVCVLYILITVVVLLLWKFGM
jgi:hydrogenase-4 component B